MFKHTLHILSLVLILSIHFEVSGQSTIDESQETSGKSEKSKKISFRHPEDGALDLSEFLVSPVGFFPVPIIITEPAVGYGGGAALIFFHPQKKKYSKPVPPNISGAIGLATQNKTWLAGGFHSHVFGEDRVRTLSVIAKPNVRIKYYGNNSEILSEFPITLKLDSWLFMQRALVRLGSSNWFAGASYIYFYSKVGVQLDREIPIISPILERLQGNSVISSIKPRINFDNRNNTISPTNGFNTGAIFNINAKWLGADEDYYSMNEYLLAYYPVSEKLFSSYRFDASQLIGDAPLYAYPFVDLRGIPALRYQSNNTAIIETEWRYELFRRWSVMGFTGAGKAYQSLENFNDIDWAYTFGTGARYNIAKALGLQTGVDFAWGNGKDFTFYIVAGTSWSK
ncbi:BamA/TamA family outer membrane protein [Reichenbachiella ulvae]|uniref:BamA/TamA family outer membrane protein n=1 Tax=Reichenbachiella ulvae TaxID=2980104 RepID=A0ABT3CS43_9BACT|nr:BamA/TamA family outer membrane protein [Reichenbachiella ulvae]MCV9386295.1 BamA/TamA family outer membrane protein [Reichenbachiella ulvae]